MGATKNTRIILFENQFTKFYIKERTLVALNTS